MKEKKQSKDWYIAAIHYLTAGFAIPFIIALVLGIPVAILIGKNNATLFIIIMSAIGIISVWLGVMYAAKYVNKTYIVKNSENIAKLATIYLVILSGGYKLFSFLYKETAIASKAINIGFFVIIIFVFYISSKKYIKNNEETKQ